jgi:hypothetical protein
MQKISFILLFDLFLEPIWICLYILKFIYCYRLDLCPYRIFFLNLHFLISMGGLFSMLLQVLNTDGSLLMRLMGCYLQMKHYEFNIMLAS